MLLSGRHTCKIGCNARVECHLEGLDSRSKSVLLSFKNYGHALLQCCLLLYLTYRFICLYITRFKWRYAKERKKMRINIIFEN